VTRADKRQSGTLFYFHYARDSHILESGMKSERKHEVLAIELRGDKSNTLDEILFYLSFRIAPTVNGQISKSGDRMERQI
jgi:hypothetical protein